MKHIVILTGAGISAESGIPTFRGEDGLWEGHNVYEVASPQGWAKDRHLVLDFYNKRRKAVIEAKPNEAHKALAKLDNYFNTTIITQNIDDLHERAGSVNVLHLHGEIRKAQSSKNPHLIYAIEGDTLKIGDKCELDSQLRPHVVWFGEMVPMMEPAAELCRQADILIIIGTSLQVYPAASLIHDVPEQAEKHFVDPDPNPTVHKSSFTIHKGSAIQKVPALVNYLIDSDKKNY